MLIKLYQRIIEFGQSLQEQMFIEEDKKVDIFLDSRLKRLELL